jgi:hypothetical protein
MSSDRNRPGKSIRESVALAKFVLAGRQDEAAAMAAKILEAAARRGK